LKLYLVTAVGDSDARYLSSVNIQFWQCSSVVVDAQDWQEASKHYRCGITFIYYYPTPALP